MSLGVPGDTAVQTTLTVVPVTVDGRREQRWCGRGTRGFDRSVDVARDAGVERDRLHPHPAGIARVDLRSIQNQQVPDHLPDHTNVLIVDDRQHPINGLVAVAVDNDHLGAPPVVVVVLSLSRASGATPRAAVLFEIWSVLSIIAVQALSS